MHDRGRDADPATVAGLQGLQARVEPEQPAGVRVALVAIEAHQSFPVEVEASRFVPVGLGLLKPPPRPAHKDLEFVGARHVSLSRRAGDPQHVAGSEQAARPPQPVGGTRAATVGQQPSWRLRHASVEILAHHASGLPGTFAG